MYLMTAPSQLESVIPYLTGDTRKARRNKGTCPGSSDSGFLLFSHTEVAAECTVMEAWFSEQSGHRFAAHAWL